SSLASIAASTSKPKHRAQPAHAPNVPARPSQPIKFSNDTERLQHINSIRKSPVGAQIKLVIELLYKDSGSHQVTPPLTMTLRTDVSILVVELRTTIRCPDRERWS
uniref:Uncharacterized protein n=1 Tax=Zea mays TaxID=4577 RepID=A0A804PSR2_MAIZE